MLVPDLGYKYVSTEYAFAEYYFCCLQDIYKTLKCLINSFFWEL
jgi:hypothetical protein